MQQVSAEVQMLQRLGGRRPKSVRHQPGQRQHRQGRGFLPALCCERNLLPSNKLSPIINSAINPNKKTASAVCALPYFAGTS